ncbi:polysaccharide biosynthesis C-terminal domain-containing protein [Urechidicola sp. KH5]
MAAVLPRVINFLLVRVHTDALETTSYAVNADFYIWASLFAVLLTFGMETAFFRFYADSDKKDVVISTAFVTTLVSVGVFVTVTILFFDQFLVLFDFGNNRQRLKLFLGVMALDTLAMIPFAYLRASNQPIKYAVIKLLNVAIIVAITLLSLVYYPDRINSGATVASWISEHYENTPLVNNIFIANIFGSAFSFLLVLPLLFKFKFSFDISLLKRMLRYGWPIAIAGVAYIINENLDKFLIKRLIGDHEMGVYAACYKIAIFMNLYVMAFKLGAEPFFFNNAKKENAQKTYALILKYFVIIGGLVIIGVVGYLDLFKHLINSNYWDALAIVPIVLMANLFLGIYHNVAVWYKLTDKTRFGMYFSIIGALITIVLNILLLPKYGYMVAAWATLVAYSSMAIISYLVGKKYYEVPYNILSVSKYLLLTGGLSALLFMDAFRDNLIVASGAVLVFIIIILLSEKKELKSILKT